jgi:hypothetical protein
MEPKKSLQGDGNDESTSRLEKVEACGLTVDDKERGRSNQTRI